MFQIEENDLCTWEELWEHFFIPLIITTRIKQNLRCWIDSRAGRVLALHAAHLGSIANTPYRLPNLPEDIPEHRIRNIPWEFLSVVQEYKKKSQKTFVTSLAKRLIKSEEPFDLYVSQSWNSLWEKLSIQPKIILKIHFATFSWLDNDEEAAWFWSQN